MCVFFRYAGKLKTHKQNLIQESDFHIREERVKAQQSDQKDKEDNLRVPSSKSASRKTTPTPTNASKATPTSSVKAKEEKTAKVKEDKPTPSVKAKEEKTSSVKVKEEKPSSERDKGMEGSAVEVTEASAPPTTGGKKVAKSSGSGERSESPKESKGKEKGSSEGSKSSSTSVQKPRSVASVDLTSNGTADEKGIVYVLQLFRIASN